MTNLCENSNRFDFNPRALTKNFRSKIVIIAFPFLFATLQFAAKGKECKNATFAQKRMY